MEEKIFFCLDDFHKNFNQIRFEKLFVDISEVIYNEKMITNSHIKSDFLKLIEFPNIEIDSLNFKGDENFKEVYQIRADTCNHFYEEVIQNNICRFPCIIKFLEFFELLHTNEKEIITNNGSKCRMNSEKFGLLTYESWNNILDKNDFQIIQSSFHFKVNINMFDYQIENFYFCFKNQTTFFTYFMENKSIKVHLKMKIQNSEAICNASISFDNRDSNSENLDKLELIVNLHLNENLFTYKFRKQKELDLKFDLIKEYLKFEKDKNYKEESLESFTIKSNLSFGRKYYFDSNFKKFEEDWWKKQDNNDSYEIKINRVLDDGYGTKTFESLGYKISDSIKLYDFHDITFYDVDKDEYKTFKKGFDLNNTWSSFIFNSKTYNLVENKATKIDTGEEWYENWWNSLKNNFCLKRGKNKEKMWEESWYEQYENKCGNLEYKYCFKTCSLLDNSYNWHEKWSEKYYDNQKVIKYCEKQNNDLIRKVLNYDTWESLNDINQ